jgi:nucleotide-binding universal stress UspA family protein
MLPLKKILTTTDFSDASYEALDRAVELARHFGAELVLLYVVPPIPTLHAGHTFSIGDYEEALRTNARDRLSLVIEKRVPPEVASRQMVGYGDPAREIVETARGEDVDLIVIATHGLTGWRHIVFGSVAESVVRRSERPVLTIRGPWRHA